MCNRFATALLGLTLAGAADLRAAAFQFSTGDADGRIGTGSRPAGAGVEIESADDFVLGGSTAITSATFQGLLTGGATIADVTQVRVEIYRVFPKDSVDPPSGNVPTRNNSPSDIAFAERDSANGSLSFSLTLVDDAFSVANTVVNGISVGAGGEGPASGQKVLVSVTLNTPFVLPADRYFFIPQVALANGQFLWLSAPKPIVPPGTPLNPDLQSWIRNENLAPDWLRLGTDIVGDTTFNAAFSLSGAAVPEPGTLRLMLAGLGLVGAAARARSRGAGR